MPRVQKRLGAVAAVAVFAVAGAAAAAEDSAFAVFGESRETSAVRVDYGGFDGFSKAFGVEDDDRFLPAYEVIADAGKLPLARYINYLEGVPVDRLSKDDQLAFWLNLRNLVVVQAISEQRRRDRLKRYRGGVEPGELWTEKRVTVKGVDLSIDDIERHVLLAHFDDPNIIYGFFQGAEGGPALEAMGYGGSSVRERLREQGREYVNSRDGLRIDDERAEVSAIYHWYKQDVFDGDDTALLSHLASHLEDPDDVEQLQAVREIRIEDFDYDLEEYEIPRRRSSGFAGGGFGGGGGGGGFGS